ncbi:hypothetical protein COP2_038638 [Malus domestica]
MEEGNSTVKDTLAFSKAGLQPTGKSSFPDLSARVTCYLYNRRCSELEALIPDINEESALRKLRAALSESTKGTPSQHFFISENAFPKNPLESHCIPHSLGYPCKQPIQSKREREQSISIWYQSSDLEPTAWNPFLIAYLALLSSTHLHHFMLSLRLPHLPGGQKKQTNTFPSCLPVVQKKQAEKNAARTINPAQGVRAEELEKLPHLLGEQIRNCNITKEQSFAVQYHQIITCK